VISRAEIQAVLEANRGIGVLPGLTSPRWRGATAFWSALLINAMTSHASFPSFPPYA